MILLAILINCKEYAINFNPILEKFNINNYIYILVLYNHLKYKSITLIFDLKGIMIIYYNSL